jgi:hypothetical protein
MITASENSHHWRSLKSPACGKDHRWQLSDVTRQWCATAGGCLMWPASGDSINIYTRRALKNFLSQARNEATPSGCQIFPPSAAVVPDCRRPSDHPAILQECPADLHERPVVVREAPPLLPVDRRRLPLGRRPFSRGPSPRHRPRVPRRPTTSSPSATTPLPYQDDILLPAGLFPNRRPGTAVDCSAAADSTAADSSAAPARHGHLISSPLGTHGGRDGAGGAATTAPAWLVFFFFFKMQLHVLKMWINRLWINSITWIVDK